MFLFCIRLFSILNNFLFKKKKNFFVLKVCLLHIKLHNKKKSHFAGGKVTRLGDIWDTTLVDLRHLACFCFGLFSFGSGSFVQPIYYTN